MADLVCKPSIVPPAGSAAEPAIGNDGWFPDLDAAALRGAMRIKDNVTPARFREAVLAAMITVGNDMAVWKAAQQLLGHASLEAVPAPRLGGESRLVVLYRRAVTCFARAELTERYRDFDQTGAGGRDLDELDGSVDQLRRDGRHAVRDLLGRSRTVVELI